MEVLSVSGLQTVSCLVGYRSVLPIGGMPCFITQLVLLLRLPGLHELPGQLAQLIGVGCRFQGAIELFDLKALLDGELDAAVHADLHESHCKVPAENKQFVADRTVKSLFEEPLFLAAC